MSQKLFVFMALFGIILHTDGRIHLLQDRQGGGIAVTCSQDLYTGTIADNAQPGTFILRVSATDGLGGPVRYNLPDTSLTKFGVHPTTGDITVTSSLLRMFLGKRFRAAFDFQVRATSAINPNNFCESTVRVNLVSTVRQDIPMSASLLFGQNSYQFTAPGCAIGSAIGQVRAQPTMDGSSVTYSIANGNPYYAINSQTGLVYITDTPPSGTQSLSVIAQSGSRESIAISVPVTVLAHCNGIKQAPAAGAGGAAGSLFSQGSYQFTTSACTAGVPVGQIFSQAFGATVLYSISPNNPFYTISAQTGQISTLGTPPQGTNTQTFTVSAVSSDQQTGQVPVTITNICNSGGVSIIPTPPTTLEIVTQSVATAINFFQPSYQFSSTGCSRGANVGTVSAQFFGSGLQYSIQGGNAFYAIDLDSGRITISTPPPSGTWTQTLTVVATTPTGQTATVPVTISSTCASPSTPAPPTSPSQFGKGFSQPSYSFSLNGCAGGILVGSVFAPGAAGVQYSISPAGNPYFAINPMTGQISTLQAPPTGPQTFNVQAVMLNGQTFTAPVTVFTVDSGPLFPPFYNLLFVTCAIGSPVGQVTAMSCGGGIVYNILGGSNFYAINQNTGQISLIAPPPPGVQRLTVQATALTGQTAQVPVELSSSCGSGMRPGENGNMSPGRPSFSYGASPGGGYSNHIVHPLLNHYQHYITALGMMNAFKPSQIPMYRSHG